MNLEEDLKNIAYKNLSASAAVALKDKFCMRPNKSCDSNPLCSYLYRYFYPVEYATIGEACLIRYMDSPGVYYGSIPYYREEALPYYFKLQEAYFNQIDHQPVIIYSADEEGVTCLRKAGALDDYEVLEQADSKDYLYDGEALRSLAGRKYSKKRNHLHQFNKIYGGRWEYRRLTPEDRNTVAALLEDWKKAKYAQGFESGAVENEAAQDSDAQLETEIAGIRDMFEHQEFFSYGRFGGIFIDGGLKAFAIGAENPKENMAVINVEKADAAIPGLYQVINQQFLLHEFPDVALVNREDDVGIENLRKSKMSYHPIGFEHKYNLRQKGFAVK